MVHFTQAVRQLNGVGSVLDAGGEPRRKEKYPVKACVELLRFKALNDAGGGRHDCSKAGARLLREESGNNCKQKNQQSSDIERHGWIGSVFGFIGPVAVIRSVVVAAVLSRLTTNNERIGGGIFTTGRRECIYTPLQIVV
jgi:hypothetical protein